MTAAEPLLPCPFCGGSVLSAYLDGNNPGNDFWINCDRCGGSCGMHDSKEEAIKSWNTRSPQSCGMVADVSKYHMTAKEDDTMANKIYVEGFNNALKLCEAEIESSVQSGKGISKNRLHNLLFDAMQTAVSMEYDILYKDIKKRWDAREEYIKKSLYNFLAAMRRKE